MNQYLKNLSKIEFVVTDACTGRCKHCSQGEHSSKGGCIDASVSANAVRQIAEFYDIKTVMTFGGEPLLYPETVAAIHKAALEMNIPHRQLITNGFFTKDPCRMRKVAELLLEAGINDILLSVDAFHEECIPMESVTDFAKELMASGLPLRTQPAWLVSKEDANPYNKRTKELLSEFETLGIKANDGNVIFPEGNAAKYFGEYFLETAVENPYVEDPFDVRCISFSAKGEVLGSNIYKKNIIEIIKKYNT